MDLPLLKRLPRKEFVELAELQDQFIDSIYSFDKELVLHGGTAIWRCYGGNRFSYDVDAYVQSKEEIELILNNLGWVLPRKGLNLDKIRHIEKTILAQVSNQATKLKVEIGIKSSKISKIMREYERADGTLLNVLTLSPEDFILEKIETYNSRRYMRDFYDIYHLINYVENKKRIKSPLKKFLLKMEPPSNTKELSGMIYSGIAPSYEDMRKYIGGKLK